MSRRVVVTGASGFVGRALLASRPIGRQLIAVSRTRPSSQDIDWRAGPELSAGADWKQLLANVDAVVHLAGRVHLPSYAQSSVYEIENSDGAIKLAKDAAEAGVRRFIFLSTAKVLGDESGRNALKESAPPSPGDAYATSKLVAERALIGMRDRMEVTILRPPLVYGAGVRANFLGLLSAVRGGLPLPFASVDNKRSLIGVNNLVSAIFHCIDSPAAVGRTYHVTDGEALSTPDLVRGIANAVGARAHLFPFPPALLEALGSALGRGDTIKRLTRSLELDDRAIRDELGWMPVQSVEQGIAETALWFRNSR